MHIVATGIQACLNLTADLSEDAGGTGLTAGAMRFVMAILCTKGAGQLFPLVRTVLCLVASYPTIKAYWTQLLHICIKVPAQGWDKQ